MSFATRASQCLYLEHHRGQVISEPVCALFRLQSLLQLRILCCYADGTSPRVAVVTITGCRSQCFVVLEKYVAIAPHGNHYGTAERHSVSTERKCLGGVGPAAYTAGHNELNLTMHAEFLQRLDSHAHGRQRWNTDVFDKYVLRRSRATLHAVDNNDIGAGFDGQCNIVLYSRRPDLDVDRDLPVSDLAQFLNLDCQIIRPRPVRMPAGATLIDSLWQVTHLRHTFCNLVPKQHAATAGLCALPDDNFESIRPPDIVRIKPIAGWQYLVDEGL